MVLVFWEAPGGHSASAVMGHWDMKLWHSEDMGTQLEEMKKIYQREKGRFYMVAQNAFTAEERSNLNTELDEFIMAWQCLRCWGHR